MPVLAGRLVIIYLEMSSTTKSGSFVYLGISYSCRLNAQDVWKASKSTAVLTYGGFFLRLDKYHLKIVQK